jgi:hypothetical protein
MVLVEQVKQVIDAVVPEGDAVPHKKSAIGFPVLHANVPISP